MTPTLLVLAAGMGSRFGGIKQIASVGPDDQTLLDYGVYDAFKAGFGKVVFVIRKDIEKDFCDKIFYRISHVANAEYVFQNQDSFLSEAHIRQSTGRTKPWGTVHAVLCAEKCINEPFAIINADDFYGFDAYNTMYKHLSSLHLPSTEHAMIGYKLKNTLSRSGTVSRGVCTVDNKHLVSMAEHKNVGYEGTSSDEKIVSEYAGKKEILTGDEIVSMNLFGFTPDAFSHFRNFFEQFIHHSASDLKAECLLPDAASKIVNDGLGSVTVYKTTEQWFGMTYQEDLELVRSAIASKIKKNEYPELLWQS
ncbi:MAG: hypothetical protein IJU92_05760 [Spirochaetaceae bacterium]|nr:hypothetical protein [Spirochaetaceae bacterium]